MKVAIEKLPDPENTLARGDVGDETAKRFRYQWTWAAILCCMLLDDKEDVVEVFCEHHEDVVLKHRDGTFTGHQVKTRREDQPPWRANDEDFIAACGKIARLERDFPDRFRQFYFLTNHAIHSARNGSDIRHVLEQIKVSRGSNSLSGNIAQWLKRVARVAGVSESVTITAMSKTIVRADLPKFSDVLARLVHTIPICWPPARDCSYNSAVRAAIALVDECGRASSLDHEQLLPAYIVTSTNAEAEILARIEGKRMTADRVEHILERGRDAKADLAGDPTSWIQPGRGKSDLLRVKLDAGGFSIVSRNAAEDLRDKADYLGTCWIKKYGPEEGLRRYNHITTTVLTDAGRAFDATQHLPDPFGPLMREDLRRRFRERREHGYELHDCTDDHLEGIAFSLTAQCEIAWSHARPWESQDGSGQSNS